MITLDTARKVMKAIELYQGPMTANSLIDSVADATLETPVTITKVIEFLQEVKKATPLVTVEAAPPSVPIVLPDIDDEPLDLMNELTYNYKIAKRVLQTSLIGDRTIDAEETRKSLKTISAFMDQALKLQERLYNAQQIQKFQEQILDLLAGVDPSLRDIIIERMLNEQ